MIRLHLAGVTEPVTGDIASARTFVEEIHALADRMRLQGIDPSGVTMVAIDRAGTRLVRLDKVVLIETVDDDGNLVETDDHETAAA